MNKYVEAELEIIKFEAEDVITTSCTDEFGCVGQDDL